jgi:two-component system LytT family sensor kinase
MVEAHLVNLLVKLAVAASLASILVRFEIFKRSLLREQRSVVERLLLALSLAALFGGGVATRVITGTYRGADVGLEGSLIAGLVGGYVPGLLAGVLISFPAMIGGELLSMPLLAAVGVLGGLVRDAAPDPEEIWRFTPFPDVGLYRIVRHWSDHRRTLFHLFFLLVILVTEFLRFLGNRVFTDQYLFAFYPSWPNPHPVHYVLVWVTTIFTVTLPIKIWSNARTERQLEAQQRLLQEARLRALTSQINPHFLFNTLNSISSLVRTKPETARVVIQKLSNILRRLLRKNENLSTLREELAFIDDYLSIELVRFGDKLRVVKDVDPVTLECMVPSMLLQPLVENSLKHGLSSKVEGGTIQLRVWRADGRLHLVVEDDGVGIPEAELADLFDKGIGVSNVNERLKVLFGSEYKMWIDSKSGEGTRTGIEIPEQTPGLAKAS